MKNILTQFALDTKVTELQYDTGDTFSSSFHGILNAVIGTKVESAPATKEVWYRVRKTWADAKSQKGAYHNLEYAKKCADENEHDTGKIHNEAYPACVIKECTRKQRNDRNFCAARHKGSKHSGGSAFAFIANGT